MANELKYSIQGTYIKGNDRVELPQRNPKIDVTGTKRSQGVQAIGDVEEAIPLGEIGTLGMCQVENLDATNYIRLGTVTGQYHIRVKPLETQVFRADNNGLFGISAAGTPELKFDLFED